MSADEETGTAEESATEVEGRGPGLLDEAPLRRGTLLGGRYEVERVIGRGGMGVVVKAHDHTLGEAVAIKILRAEYAGERLWAERLAREVKLARQIHHPNVCRVFDFQQADGRVFLVMELAAGGSLREELRGGNVRERPIEARIADAQAIAHGLAAIHAAGIVHRDLTPQNVLRMADGRLVVSDFGLATDASETTTSIHGGTIAYMAPEVVRGGRATVASDIWALGVVIHEVVFGERPRWGEGAGEMLAPQSGRQLSETERALYEACRACAVSEVQRRLITAAKVAEHLGRGGGHWRPSLRTRGALVAALSGLLVGLVLLWLAFWRSGPLPAGASPGGTPLVVPTGQPLDWTDQSIVLAEVPGRIECMRRLPDRRTLRYVWGNPLRAEDLDTQTRQRIPSPLAPEAYAEGCPDLSPDGRRLVYTGHTDDHRAFAFVSSHPDGREGVPTVPIAEPTMSSDPTWIDNDSFSYELDSRHLGAYSTTTKRGIALPEPSSGAHLAVLGHVVLGQVLVNGGLSQDQTEVAGFHWPTLTEQTRFRLSANVLDIESRDGNVYLGTTPRGRTITPLIAYERSTGKAKWSGLIQGQLIRYPRFVEAGFSFVSISFLNYATMRSARGDWTKVPVDGDVVQAAECGRDVVVVRVVDEGAAIERMSMRSGQVRTIARGPLAYYPTCSADGKSLFYVGRGNGHAVFRCDIAGCWVVLDGYFIHGLAASPSGERLALVVVDRRGPRVQWIRAGGGELQDVSETETACLPGWTSDHTVWISRRQGKSFTWVETDVDSRRPTGRTSPGSRECSDGSQDPLSPVDRDSDVRTVFGRRSQVRLLPKDLLTAANGF